MVRGDFRPSLPARSGRGHKIERRLAAVIGADIAGYSALMVRAEEETHRRVGAELDRVFREIEKSHGRVFAFAGDGLMAEFPSAVEALKCALRIQADAGKRNARLPADNRIAFRIGINSGEIMVQRDRTGGNAVNIAARLEQIAEPGGVCLSSVVFEQVRRVVAAGYEFIGEQHLKNIREPVPAYGVRASSCSSWLGMPALPRLSAGPTADAGVEYRPSLAVLPFRTLQRDQSDAYFAEGMVDDIIRALGGLKDLLVISRSATIGFARLPIDVRRIGHELDVRYVLHGSVRREGGALRIAVELSEAPSGNLIWADRFDGALAELFDLQDRIALRVATAIAPHLRGRELSRALRKHPESMTAYDLTLQALDLFYRMEREPIDQAQTKLYQAIAHDPGYALAYSHMAYLYMARIGQGWSGDRIRDIEAAARAAAMAVERDPNDALGLAFHGHVQSYLLQRFDLARKILDRALVAGSSCAWAWSLSGLTYGYLGDHAKCIAHTERAVRLAPIGHEAYWHEHFLSIAYYFDERYDDAVAWGRMSAAHAGGNSSNLRVLAASLVGTGEMDEARSTARKLVALDPTARLSEVRIRTPFQGKVRERFIEHLQAAGVAE